MCQVCQSGKYENVSYWLLECDVRRTECQPLLQCMRQSITSFNNLFDDDKLGQGMATLVSIESFYEDVDHSIPVIIMALFK